MKRAKVSSVYEGRGRKRSKEGEELIEREVEYSAKTARISAKARTEELRTKKALSIAPNNRNLVTRTMARKSKEKKDEINEITHDENEMLFKEEEHNDDDKPVEVVQPEQQLVDDEVVLEKKGDDGGSLNLEDLPMKWTYEEEWSWFKVGYECGWYSYWETMTGDFWAPNDNKKAV